MLVELGEICTKEPGVFVLSTVATLRQRWPLRVVWIRDSHEVHHVAANGRHTGTGETLVHNQGCFCAAC
jgi:hypothetical protein